MILIMRRGISRKALSALLTLAMLLSLIPGAAFAAGETGTYQKISAQDQFTTGQYVMVVDTGYAVGALDGTWLTATEMAAEGDIITGPAANLVWTITVDGDSAVLTDANGVTVAPKGGNENGIVQGDYDWSVVFADGTFQFQGTGEDTVTLASNKGSGNKFRAYKNSTISGNPAGYPRDFTLYKLDGEPVEPTPEPEGDTAALVDLPADGDTVVLYYPAGGKVMSSERYTYTSSSGNSKDELVALDAEAADGALDVPDGAAEFQVTVDADGRYTFQSSEGYLYLDGTHVRLVKEQGEYTLFELEETDGGLFVKSTNAQFSGKPQYLEFYGGYFTCFGMGSDPSIYTFQFYKTGTFDPGETPDPEPTPDPDAPIADGDRVVIYNPAYGKALSATYSGYYNNGTDVTVGSDGTLSGYSASDVWTVIDNGDGTWSFSYEEQNLGMGDSFTSMPLDEVHDKWELEEAPDGCYYIKNVGRGNYMEWYSEKNSWSAPSFKDESGLFAQKFYVVTGEIPDPEPGGDLPEAGDQVVLYNLSAQGVLALQDDNAESPSITNAAAVVDGGTAAPENGGVVFTVEKNGEYFRFYNESYGYLCSNGTGNNAFYQKEAGEDADWTLAVQGSGYTLESRTAKFNGRYSQYLEYYGGTYKTYSMYNVTDYDIYTFQFYPVAEGVNVTDGVVNVPAVTFGTLTDAYVGAEYTVTFTVDAVFGVDTVTASYGETEAQLTEENGSYSFTIPGEALAEGELTLTVTGADTKGVAFTGTAALTVKDEPVITSVAPAANSQTGEDKRPVLSVTFSNAGENPTVSMTVNDVPVEAAVSGNTASYTPAEDLADGRTTVTATITRADGKSVSRTWSFTVGVQEYALYFGQLHSHTTYSDGSGSLESALNYVAGLPESANVDFVAFTDHSNYFDASGNANPEGALYDTSLMTSQSQTLWNEYKGAVADFNAEHAGELVALAGFEMTWSGGPGHINTFNTEGLVSRNNTTLNSKTSDAGLKAYYSLLSQTEGVGSISQFNHPGDTFGTFVDFAYWDAVIDTRIQLVEVGNGEGAIGAGGYYPSYEYYIMALDKGWHVAPTNNQDNHKGKWGNANDARDVILTDDFSEEGIYQAIRDRRVYATEDKNLEINYTLNDAMLGTILDDEGVEQANINVTVYDPDASDSIARVEVVVNSGAVAYTWDDPEELASGALSCTIPADYSYYFIRVTQGDGDIAVTAPVWVGETLKLGISSVTCGTANPVTDEEVTITTNLFNSEAEEATVNSVTYTSRGETLYTDTTGYTIPAAGGTLAIEWKYTPTQARLTPITVTVSMTQGGMEYTYSMEVTLDVLDAEQLVYIGIDASHYNEYVNGNYKDSMGNFGNLAAGYQVRTVELATSEDLIAACENAEGKYVAIILTAPSRRDGSALRDPYVTYSQEEIQALVDFNAAGGALILAGWSDYYESYADFPAEDHMAAQQNQVLAALGSSLRIGDDATNDDERNGGQTQRLYFNTYNWDSFLVDGVDYDAEHDYDNMYTQLFSQYGGASIYVVDETGAPTAAVPDTVTPVVYGHATTYSKDSDGDGLGGDSMPKYPASEGDDRLMVLATEDLGDGKGLIIVSGAAFMSNFEVQAEVEDSGAEKNYSNYNICENLVEYLNPVAITPIADVQAQEMEGVRYTIEGVVTSNASGYDQATAFFDCIYVQDESAGINAFPVSGDYKVGEVVRITGTTSSYQGERQIAVSSIEKVGESTVEPKQITTKEAAESTYLGSLVQIQGVVVSYEEANGLVQTIMVRDESGYDARVFIDGYITTDKTIENLAVGHEITVTGLASYDNTFNAPEGPFPRIRIRDRADIVCGTEVVDIPPSHEEQPGQAPAVSVTGGRTALQNERVPYRFTFSGTDENLAIVSVVFTVTGERADLFTGGAYELGEGFQLLGKDEKVDEAGNRQIAVVLAYHLDGAQPSGAVEDQDLFTYVLRTAVEGRGDIQVTIQEATFGYTGATDPCAATIEGGSAVTTVMSQRYDLDLDGDFDEMDLVAACGYYRAQQGDADWTEASIADVDGNGVVDLADLVEMANALAGSINA
ncbi:MAG TPA: CehA/McbA family metallohydrolase [Candidatus Flavonifractor intestinipullorum]|uniref:CehA/McbA family metallohydrolase n=1 Tax=Candidatus Flavonifractor intestinipullorum TaxID=2838587 RepID=A0A9D2MAI7_9FIRM|nr:CehA/McbA family metallohydrolase [Candidatus Flavonifractor intestinipullorum]